jgi:1,4-dihydroxy-2-naphthoate octaprenyltransferase
VAYLSLPLLVAGGLPWPVALAVLMPAPVALWLARRMGDGAWKVATAWNGLGFWSVALLMGTAVLETAGFVWVTIN